jgi:hypothetical protein
VKFLLNFRYFIISELVNEAFSFKTAALKLLPRQTWKKSKFFNKIQILELVNSIFSQNLNSLARGTLTSVLQCFTKLPLVPPAKPIQFFCACFDSQISSVALPL